MSCGSSGVSRLASLRTAVFSPDSEKLASGRPSIGRGKANRAGSPLARGALDLRSARIGQAQHLGDLVEGFAHRVVDGGAEPHIIADAEHGDDLGVAAGGEEQAIGKRERAGQPRRQRMRLEMVDRDQRRVVHHRDRLGGGQADDDAADQAGPGGGGDRRQLRIADAGLLHGAVDDAVEHVDMGARRDLRHHAAEAGMLLGLRAHDIGQDPAAPSLRRSITAAAVSSQVVSMPSTSIGVSLSNLSPCVIAKAAFLLSPGSIAGRDVQSSAAANTSCRLGELDAWPFLSPARIPTMRPPRGDCARGASRCCTRRCCGSSRSLPRRPRGGLWRRHRHQRQCAARHRGSLKFIM